MSIQQREGVLNSSLTLATILKLAMAAAALAGAGFSGVEGPLGTDLLLDADTPADDDAAAAAAAADDGAPLLLPELAPVSGWEHDMCIHALR